MAQPQISRVYFVPIKTDFGAGRGPQPLETNEITLAAPRAMYFSVAGVDGMENVKDDKGFREAVSASRRNEQGAFVDPRTGRAFPVSRVVKHDV